MDVVRERRRGERSTLELAVAEQVAPEAERSQPRQQRERTGAVIYIGRLQIEFEQRAVLVADDGPYV